MPFDLGDAGSGGRDYAYLVKEQLEAQHAKRPPSKRVNHGLFNIPCPFFVDWAKAGVADEQPAAIRTVEKFREVWDNPAAPISSPLVPVRLISTKGTPAPFTHLYAFSTDDFAEYLASMP